MKFMKIVYILIFLSFYTCFAQENKQFSLGQIEKTENSNIAVTLQLTEDNLKDCLISENDIIYLKIAISKEFASQLANSFSTAFCIKNINSYLSFENPVSIKCWSCGWVFVGSSSPLYRGCPRCGAQN